MKGLWLLLLLGLATAYAIDYNNVKGAPYTVSFDSRAFKINGDRLMIQSGSIHYPRSTPDMWPRIMQLSKAAGLNTIETYAFWNIHEPHRGQYDFSSPAANITGFLQEAANAGLFIILRIGPFVCAEWTYGGLPVWLRDIPQIEFRTYNQPWLNEMERFMSRVLQEVEPFLARNGGPIILAQVENEYGNIEAAYGDAAHKYVAWAAQTANNYNISIPWIMCQQDDAPDSVIATCNGYYCDNWLDQHFANHPNKPGCFTENWPGWFQNWGQPVPHRPTEDISFSIARWVARGGTMFNYYMIHGGTNFARYSGGPLIITSYDYDVAIDEFGWPHEPKYSHTAALHSVLNQYSQTLLQNNRAPTIYLGLFLEGHVYGTPDCQTPQCCLAFLSNIRSTEVSDTITLMNHSFVVPDWSVSLVDCSTWQVLHNTATISQRAAPAVSAAPVTTVSPLGFSWLPETSIDEAYPFTSERPLEQIGVTKDASDYLWYVTMVNLTQQSVSAGQAVLSMQVADYFHVFLDDQYLLGSLGSPVVAPFKLNVQNMSAGLHQLKILCKTEGLINYGVFFEQYKRGVGLGDNVNTSIVIFDGQDLTSNGWKQRPMLTGEALQYFDPDVAEKLPWNTGAPSEPTGLTWWRLDFPIIDNSLQSSWALDLSSMGKGMAWVNGHMIGRYWDVKAVGLCLPCDYRGSYDPLKCLTGCGQNSQSLYHVPVAWLNADQPNLVILFDEVPTSNPTNVQFVKVH